MANTAVMEDLLERILREMQSQNRGAGGNLLQLARQSGMDPRVIRSTEERLRALGNAAEQTAEQQRTSGSRAGTLIGNLFADLANSVTATAGNLVKFGTAAVMGKAKIEDFFMAFKDLPFGLGSVAQGLASLAKAQMESLNSFRDLTRNGINFGESLAKLRNDSITLGLELGQFVSIMKENSETFRFMGTSANDGAKNFRNLNLELVRNDRGLKNLGFGFEDLNKITGMYARSINGISQGQLQDYNKLGESVAAYGKELDLISRLTGKSREQIAKELEEAQAEANFQAYMTTLTTEQQEKLATALNEAGKVGGKGLQDVVKAQAMGISVQTEAGKTISSMASQTSQMYRDRTNQAMDTSIKADQFRSQSASAMAKATHMAAEEQRRLGKTLAIVGMQGGAMAEHMSALAKNTIEVNKRGGETLAQTDARYRQELENQKTDQARVDSDRAAAQNMEDAMRRFNAEMNRIMPMLVDKLLVPAMNWFSANSGTISSAILKGAQMLTDFLTNLTSESGRKKILDDIAKFIKETFVPIAKEIGNGIVSSIGDYLRNNSATVLGTTGMVGGAAIGGAIGGLPGAALGAGIGGIGGLLIAALSKLFEGRDSGTYGATGKLFEDFGQGTPIIAHGIEGVFKPDQIQALMSGSAASGVREAVDSLNKTQQQLLLTMKQVAEYSRRTLDATKSLGNNSFA